jgi:hypothetical protein
MLGVLTTEIALPLQVLKAQTWAYKRWRFYFQIIGESHLIRVERDGNLYFHEILACVPLDPTACQHAQPFRELAEHRYQQHNYQVRVAFSTEAHPEDRLGERGLEVRFPRVHRVTPVTRIQWARRGDQIVWWTLHTYPAFDQVIYVRSWSSLSI